MPRRIAFGFAAILLVAVRLSAQSGPIDLTIDTGSVAPKRFLAAKGQRALLQGYASQSLEGWIYPFQIFDQFQVSFSQASSGLLPGASLLRRVIYRPEAITRIYAAQDFTVRETLLVPRDQPGIAISYEVEGANSVDVTVEFHPVLDLMWPAGLGGQDTSWSEPQQAFRIAEGSARFYALIGSRQIVSHNEPNGYREPWRSARHLSFTMRAAPRATMAVALELPEHYSADATYKLLLEKAKELQAESFEQYRQLQTTLLSLETPDNDVNLAFGWAETAIHQAWVCNPYLGCGLTGGYGPSRDTRRPQYAWFFAGDGLVTLNAIESVGGHVLAEQAYAFLTKYQNQQSGMMWHEISQSATFLDWFQSLPYAFAHVDISAQFISQFARTLAWSGDRDQVARFWPALEKSYGYSESLLAADGLPRIPRGKQGPNEQNTMAEEFSLSSGWGGAASAYARLADARGLPEVARSATSQSAKAWSALMPRFWDEQKKFPVLGIRPDGSKLKQQMSSALGLAGNANVAEAFRNPTLDRLSSSAFVTDWGVRSLAADDAAFQASSYAGGSVWPVGTAAAARVFWAEHRPLTALPLWYALVAESFFDSPGHLDEVFAGNAYRELDVSVPEQSWSSAGLVTATVEGLLGIEPNALAHQITLAPHLPSSWHQVSVQRLRVGGTTLSFTLQSKVGLIHLKLSAEGEPVVLRFAPQVPFGSTALRAQVNGRSASASLERHENDWHAAMDIAVSGSTVATIQFTPGVAPEVAIPKLQVGEISRAPRVIQSTWHQNVFTAKLDMVEGTCPEVLLRTAWKPITVDGGRLMQQTPEYVTVQAVSNSGCQGTAGNMYRPHTLRVHFQPPSVPPSEALLSKEKSISPPK